MYGLVRLKELDDGRRNPAMLILKLQALIPKEVFFRLTDTWTQVAA
jgi:hypothetical protein